MSRSKPTVLCSHKVKETTYEVCAADDLYAVLYCGQPIKLRMYREDTFYLGPKYGKTVFPEPGHAIRLAEKLNKAHNTTDFSVAVVRATSKVIPISNKYIPE